MPVVVFPNTEGSPLLECQAGDVILSLLERTGPYTTLPGRASAIINVTAGEVAPSEYPVRRLEVPSVSQVVVSGLVLSREDQFLVIDAGIPLVVGVQGSVPESVSAGDWVTFEGIPPIHGFIVSGDRRRPVVAGDDRAI